jgi:tRNA-specific 2-thiouridylase
VDTMRIVVAMSGGVDSSVAAALLADQGHEVIGLSMQLYDQTEGQSAFGSCCSIDDLHDARRVAAAISIPHYIVNFERQFDDQVVSNFVHEYAAGRTPLPCAHCNSDLKFATLADRARLFGADAVATGHYARVERDAATGRMLLKRGVDAGKDQSYFLFSLTQDQLACALFPVGDRPKDQVRDYARMRRLPVADKPDSQEICFIPDHDYRSFVARKLPDAARGGAFVDEHGRVLGRHEGIHRFTIGQRKGLGLESPTGTPMYVLALRPADRQVVVGPKGSLERTTLTASGVNWIVGEPAGPVRVAAQIRHRHQPAAATVSVLESASTPREPQGRPGPRQGTTGSGRATVIFDAPQLAITPGQAVVFYDGDVVVGGGWID